jgi:hypothetical protein
MRVAFEELNLNRVQMMAYPTNSRAGTCKALAIHQAWVFPLLVGAGVEAA